MIKPFKFFLGYVYNDEYTLPLMRRMSGRTIAQNLVPVQPMERPRNNLFHLEQHISRFRWIDTTINNLRFSIYTHLSIEEVQRIVRVTILPFLYELDNTTNRRRLLQMLQANFHNAYFINE